jgi:hypothetical protein
MAFVTAFLLAIARHVIKARIASGGGDSGFVGSRHLSD